MKKPQLEHCIFKLDKIIILYENTKVINPNNKLIIYFRTKDIEVKHFIKDHITKDGIDYILKWVINLLILKTHFKKADLNISFNV